MQQALMQQALMQELGIVSKGEIPWGIPGGISGGIPWGIPLIAGTRD